jgi:hypothetical protein
MCALAINEPRVSGVHAEIRWNGQGWELKDLGSLNGTYLDGQRIDAGAVKVLRQGSRVAFGQTDREWELVDAAAPLVLVVPIDGGDPVAVENDLVALPSSEDLRATLYRSRDGEWTLERADEAPVTLARGQIFECARRLWRFSCPVSSMGTLASTVDTAERLDLAMLRLTLSFNRNQEYVHVRAIGRTTAVDLGESVYNYLLLRLARRRLDDAERGIPETSQGWVDVSELAEDPMFATPQQLNLAVFRIRKQFADAGIADSARIVERRSSTREMRLGTGRVSVAAL